MTYDETHDLGDEYDYYTPTVYSSLKPESRD